MREALEGSDERRQARMLLLIHAEQARALHLSFDGWLERERQDLIDAVSTQDLISIGSIIWG